jgi:hypothetical protein
MQRERVGPATVQGVCERGHAKRTGGQSCWKVVRSVRINGSLVVLHQLLLQRHAACTQQEEDNGPRGGRRSSLMAARVG